MSGEKVLVVEDNFMNMRLTEHILKAEGYITFKADSVRAALKQIKNTVPDLILMDIQLPDVDGMTAVRILKSDPLTRNIPVLALTPCAMKGDKEKILEMGCDGYISKPISVRDFIATLRKYLKAGASH
jgi:two-component system cell cycle response regulator DivK